MNMSYCAFENTSRDLADAIDKIEDLTDNQEELLDMSHYEARGLDELLANAKRIVELETEIADMLEEYYEQRSE